jgi:N utilization substance protein B
MKPQARRKARRLALQAIYQWQFTDNPIAEIAIQFRQECNPKKVDVEYFSELLKGVVKNITKLDEQIQQFSDRPLKDINRIELAILHISIYELMFRSDIPYKVIINEALESAKAFGAEEGFKFINGILDKVAKQIR